MELENKASVITLQLWSKQKRKETKRAQKTVGPGLVTISHGQITLCSVHVNSEVGIGLILI